VNRRAVAVLVVAIFAVASTAGTSAFSATTTDRSVRVDVVDDASAYLGVERTTNETGNESVLAVTVTNRFPGGVALSNVTVRHGDADRTVATDVEPLASGEAATATFGNASCGGSVVVTASGDGVSVQLRRPVPCE
jgi:hypothetical protein